MVERWIVAPKAEGSSPSLYPMTSKYNYFQIYLKTWQHLIVTNLVNKFNFLANFYTFNEIILQEGLFIDFLQKKIVDNWIKFFLVYSAYLFNERLAFETIIRFYIELLLKPLHYLFVFEFHNVSNLLFLNLVMLSFFFLIVSLTYLSIFLF